MGYAHCAGGCKDFPRIFDGRLQPAPQPPYPFARTAPAAGEPNHRTPTEETSMNFELLIPISLFAAIAYSIKAVVDARVRKQLVSSNGSAELVTHILKGDEANRRLSSLRWGITMVALALGFGIVEAAGWSEITPGVIAVLVGAIGLGNLASYAASRKLG
jgi:hypothetical protein